LNRGTVLRPVHGGRPGHPIVISGVVADAVPGQDEPGGLAAVIRRAAVETIGVVVEDEGVHANINTREREVTHGR